MRQSVSKIEVRVFGHLCLEVTIANGEDRDRAKTEAMPATINIRCQPPGGSVKDILSSIRAGAQADREG